DRSYGQGGTVAVPLAQGPQPPSMPRGQFPPGIGDVLAHISGRYTSWCTTVKEVDWCFLVGGPGNGKSETLKELAGRLGVSLPGIAAGRRVPRTIPRDWPSAVHVLGSGLGIVLINDGSIPRDNPGGASATPSLFKDLADALERLNGTA